jgi:GNAT superfamily N-acetyltransferase
MPDHAQDKRHARNLITSVLAADCACAPGDLLTSGTTFSLAREISGRRRYPLLDPSLLIVTTGHGVAIAANEERLEWLRTRLADRERDEIFAATTIVELAELVAPDGQVLIGPTISYACSCDTFWPAAAPADVEIGIVEHDAIPALYAHPGFDHALAYRTRVDRQDRIAAVARRAGEIVGIAACSDDAEALWQIGVDVVPTAQGSGIGRALVSGLTARILAEGRVPFYTAAASNIASCSLALGLGYWPAWTALRSAASSA